MNSSVLNCRISKRGEGFEGTVSIAGLRPTKLTRVSDGNSVYSTRSGVTNSARAMAERFGLTLNIEDNKTNSKTSKKTSAWTEETAQVF